MRIHTFIVRAVLVELDVLASLWFFTSRQRLMVSVLLKELQ